MSTNKINILLISFFYERRNANVLCVEYVLKHLASNQFDVHVLCAREELSRSNTTAFDTAIKVHRIPSKLLDFREKMEKTRAMNRVGRETGRTYRFLADKLSLEIKSFTSKSTIRYAERIIKEYGITHVMSISQPFFNHQLAYRIRSTNSSIRWILYEFDPYAYNYSFPEKLVEARKAEEHSLFMLADKIILTDHIGETNKRNGFGGNFEKKAISVPLPNLKLAPLSSGNSNFVFDSQKVNLVFTGDVYGGIRKPEVILDILSRMKDSRFVFHVFGYGMEALTKQYTFLPDQVVLHGRVPKDELLNAMNSASVFVNFGNTMENQTPSKVFDYIGAGKPIVNFCFTENDTSLYYLKRYPVFLNIYNSDIKDDETMLRFKDFCLQNKGATISQEEIVSIYGDLLSENVCSLIAKHVVA